ncbi:MAG: hypothetical protein AB7O21_16480 [Gammaproteobacteria bacterium]
MLTAPVDHPLNLTMQTIVTAASWGLTALLLLVALRYSLRERTPFYVLLVLAVIVGAFVEPLYDTAMMLWFYAPGMWSHFSAFGIPQPVWTHSGYAILYATPALFINRRIASGTYQPNDLYVWAGIEFAMSCTFEMTVINAGCYEYWGPHVFRVFEYPLVIGILETAQVMCFAVAAAVLRRRVSRPVSLLALFALFPAIFIMGNLGFGGPLVIALHFDAPSAALVYAGTLLSIGFALLAIRLAANVSELLIDEPPEIAVRAELMTTYVMGTGTR